MTKYTQTGGSLKTYAARKVSGTATSHINIVSTIIPNLVSPPPLKQPHIRQVLIPSPTKRQMGLIEAWGSGIKRILNAAEKYGLPKPRIQEFDNMFRVELFRKNSLTKRERIDFIDELELGRRRDGESSEKGRRRIAILN